MKFKYAGPLDAVDVPELGLVGVKRGETVDATGPAAQSLQAQPDTWKRVAPPKPRKPKTPAKSAAKNEE